MKLKPVHLDLDSSEQFGNRPMDAYERLLLDVLRGNPTLFMRWDELEAAWRWVEPVMRALEASGEGPKPYPSGSYGPASSSAICAFLCSVPAGYLVGQNILVDGGAFPGTY
jgi:glucose-6-phosphate 1-dehydrogenase